MASETRKLKRAQSAGKAAQDGTKPGANRGQVPDPLGQGQLKQMLTRIGLILLAIWVAFGTLAAFVSTPWARTLLAIPALLTLAAVGLVVWTLRQAKTARGVASILSGVETDEDRKAALERLSTEFKKGDTAAIFARAQLEMQDDPKKALATLESIDLQKVLGPVADETRGQRAMIHLTQGEVSQARQLADNIDLSRHQEARTRAMLSAVVAEAWARSGDAKKARDTLDLFDPEEAALEQIRPQLYRSLAYTAAYESDLNAMRKALRKMLAVDARLLAGFLMKKTHPLLQKEAKKMLEQSGQVPKKMVVQRRV